MKIIIETIPHEKQRYPTVGDWWWEKDDSLQRMGRRTTERLSLQIRVSALSDWRREALIAVHELWEVLLCKHRKIKQEDVDKFDLAYENNRVEGDYSEPGDDAKAPYRNEHCSATGVERILAAELGVVWKDYEDEISNL